MSAENLKKSISLPRVMVVGTSRGVGASTIFLGLLVALRRQNIGVASAKIGYSLAEPTHHRRVANRLSYSLDPWLLSYPQFFDTVGRLAGGTEIALIEGESGLFDLWPEDCSFQSQVEMAAALGCPIILVIDATGYRESIAALLHGFNIYDERVQIAGVIANKIKNEEHERAVREAILNLAGPKYLGGVKVGDPHQTGGTLSGSSIYNPSALTRNRVIGSGNLVQESVDLQAVCAIGNLAGEIEVEDDSETVSNRIAKIAVADDQAFHLTYQDNLDLIRRAGGELVAFSPIADRKLPSGCQGLYLPGGYVHLYASDLYSNKPMRTAIADFAAKGGVIYAEGSALTYLCKKIILHNKSSFEMAGVLPGTATAMVEDSVSPKLSFYELKAVCDSILSIEGVRLRGFREDRWNVRLEEPVAHSFELRDRYPREDEEEMVLIPEGFMPRPTVLATRLHLHWGARPALAKRFVESAKNFVATT